MTKIKVALSVLLLFQIGSALAGSGSSVIPWWARDTNTMTFINVSNISDSQVKVCIKLFDHTGSLYTTGVTAGLAFVGNPVNSSCATLEAKQTGSISVAKTTAPNINGYGTIEWSSTGDQSVAMVAYGGYQQSAFYMSGSITINGSRPF